VGCGPSVDRGPQFAFSLLRDSLDVWFSSQYILSLSLENDRRRTDLAESTSCRELARLPPLDEEPEGMSICVLVFLIRPAVESVKLCASSYYPFPHDHSLDHVT
jgi:hypothetical protein